VSGKVSSAVAKVAELSFGTRTLKFIFSDGEYMLGLWRSSETRYVMQDYVAGNAERSLKI
jgi:hypothetical protein